MTRNASFVTVLLAVGLVFIALAGCELVSSWGAGGSDNGATPDVLQFKAYTNSLGAT